MRSLAKPPLRACSAARALATSLVLGLACGALLAQPQAIVFAACPVYRDTDNGRKSGCWLADDPASGRRYDVSDSSSKPWVGRMLLVEGLPSQSPDICGGQVLSPVRVSVLEAHCPELLIPAEGYPSKPSVLPKDFIKPTSVARDKNPAPYARRTFELFFDLGSDFFNYQESDTVLERAALYALDSQARAVSVQGFADAQGLLLQGERYAEDAALARQRQEKVKAALLGFGVPPGAFVASAAAVPSPPATPLSLLGRRRVVITVEP